MSSLRYPFALDVGMRRVAQEPDHAAHVEQLIKQVLFTSPGERVDRPEFGCGLRRMVFAPLSDVAESLTRITVLESLGRWMGDLIRIEDVKVTVSDEMLEVAIVYALRASGERRYLNLEVTL